MPAGIDRTGASASRLKPQNPTKDLNHDLDDRGRASPADKEKGIAKLGYGKLNAGNLDKLDSKHMRYGNGYKVKRSADPSIGHRPWMAPEPEFSGSLKDEGSDSEEDEEESPQAAARDMVKGKGKAMAKEKGLVQPNTGKAKRGLKTPFGVGKEPATFVYANANKQISGTEGEDHCESVVNGVPVTSSSTTSDKGADVVEVEVAEAAAGGCEDMTAVAKEAVAAPKPVPVPKKTKGRAKTPEPESESESELELDSGSDSESDSDSDDELITDAARVAKPAKTASRTARRPKPAARKTPTAMPRKTAAAKDVDCSIEDAISANPGPRLLSHTEWEELGFGDGPWAKYKLPSSITEPCEPDIVTPTIDMDDIACDESTTIEVNENVPEVIDNDYEPILAHEVTVTTGKNSADEVVVPAVPELTDEEKLKNAQEKWAIKLKDFDPATARRAPSTMATPAALPAVNNGAYGCKEDPEALEAVLLDGAADAAVEA